MTLRRDGFVSLDANKSGGWLQTKAFVMPAGKLHLNIDAAGGEARVILCDVEGQPLPSVARSQPIPELRPKTTLSPRP